MPSGIYKRKPEQIKALVEMNKSISHRKKVSKSLIGHKFTKETLKKMSKNHADFNGDKNPNWKGDKVGVIGVHIWLKKYFKKTMICYFCRKKCLTDYALLKGKKYQRMRENFVELCRKCHVHYDRNITTYIVEGK